MEIILDGEKGIRIPRKLLKKTIKKALLKVNFDIRDKEISVYLTKDTKIKKLNKAYRKKDKATDVLSFPIPKNFLDYSNNLGDIIISVETAKKNAVKNNILYTRELARLTIHGVLHLLGYEHENVSKRKREEMFSLQEIILKEVF